MVLRKVFARTYYQAHMVFVLIFLIGNRCNVLCMTYHLLEWSQEHCPDPQKRWTPGTSEVAPEQYKTSCLRVRKSRSPERLYQQTTDISAVGEPHNGQGRGNDTANTSNLESWDSNRVLTIVGIFFVVKRHVARGSAAAVRRQCEALPMPRRGCRQH